MTEEEINPILKKQLLGEILVKRKVITEAQLAKALRVQREEQKGYIGEILVRLGFAEERDIVIALVVQCNLPYINITKYEIEESILQLIPSEFARQNRVVPLDCVGNVLSVVMGDPLDMSVKAQLVRLTGCTIAPFICTSVDIQKAIDHWYREK